MKTQTTTIEPLLSLAETREVLGVSRMTLWRIVDRGDLPIVRIGDRPLFDPEDVRAFIASNRAPKTRDPAERPGLGDPAGSGGGRGTG
jgi:excisionase family DNA binding protein